MKRVRFRVVLPVVVGFLSLILFSWEHENNRVIESMGMAWDMGPPMWPYRALPIFSYALNAPAYIACWPIIKLTNPTADWVVYAVWLTALTILWWWVGTRIDFGLLGPRNYGHPKPVAVSLVLVALVLLAISLHVGFGEYRLFQDYGPVQPPVYSAILLLRAIGPILWCLAFAAALIRSAFQCWLQPA